MNTKLIRSDLGMTQEQFAERYNISLATVRNWDARDCMPSYLATIFAEICGLKQANENMRVTLDSCIEIMAKAGLRLESEEPDKEDYEIEF